MKDMLVDSGILRLVYSLGFHAAKCEEGRKNRIDCGSAVVSQQSTRKNLDQVGRILSKSESGGENAGEEMTLEDFCLSEAGAVQGATNEKPSAPTLSLTIKTEGGGKTNSITVQSPVMTMTLPADFNFSDSKALGELLSRVNPGHSNSETAFRENNDDSDSNGDDVKVKEGMSLRNVGAKGKEKPTPEGYKPNIMTKTPAPFYESDVIRDLLGSTASTSDHPDEVPDSYPADTGAAEESNEERIDVIEILQSEPNGEEEPDDTGAAEKDEHDDDQEAKEVRQSEPNEPADMKVDEKSNEERNDDQEVMEKLQSEPNGEGEPDDTGTTEKSKDERDDDQGVIEKVQTEPNGEEPDDTGATEKSKDERDDDQEMKEIQKSEPNGEEEYHSFTATKLTEGWLMLGKEECTVCRCPLMIAPDSANFKEGICVNEKCDHTVQSGSTSHTSVSTESTDVEKWECAEYAANADTFSDRHGGLTKQKESDAVFDNKEVIQINMAVVSNSGHAPPKPEGLLAVETSGDTKARPYSGSRPPMPDVAPRRPQRVPPKDSNIAGTTNNRPPRQMPPAPDQQMSSTTNSDEVIRSKGKPQESSPNLDRRPMPGDLASSGPSPDSRSVYSSKSRRGQKQKPSPESKSVNSPCAKEMVHSRAPKMKQQPPRPGNDCTSMLSRKSVCSCTQKKAADKPRPEDCSKSVYSRATTKSRRANRPRPEDCAKSVRSRTTTTVLKRVDKPRPEDCTRSLARSRITRRKCTTRGRAKPPTPGGGDACCGQSFHSRHSRFGPPSVVGLRVQSSSTGGGSGGDDDSASELSDLHAGGSVVTEAMSIIMDRMNAAKSLMEHKSRAGANAKNRSELAKLVETLSSAAEAVRKLEQLQLQQELEEEQ